MSCRCTDCRREICNQCRENYPRPYLTWVMCVDCFEHSDSNGNLIITNCHAGPDQPQLIEITRDKEIVWTFHDLEMFSDSMSNAVIIEDGFNDR